MKDNLLYIREKFSNKINAIKLIMAEDPEFVSLCEDHDDSVNALRHWVASKEPEAGIMASEYRVLIEELREEIIQFLNARKPG